MKEETGSLTVESALVMGVILLLIGALIRFSFGLYDRVIKKAADYSAAFKAEEEAFLYDGNTDADRPVEVILREKASSRGDNAD